MSFHPRLRGRLLRQIDTLLYTRLCRRLSVEDLFEIAPKEKFLGPFANSAEPLVLQPVVISAARAFRSRAR